LLIKRIFVYLHSKTIKTYIQMENLTNIKKQNEETIKALSVLINKFKQDKTDAVLQVVTEYISDKTGIDVSILFESENNYRIPLRTGIHKNDLCNVDGQYIFGRSYREYVLDMYVNMSSFNSDNFHKYPNDYDINQRIAALQLTPFLTEDFVREISDVVGTIHLGADEDFAMQMESKKNVLSSENLQLANDIQEIWELQVLETLQNNDVVVDDRLYWGVGDYSYEYAEELRIDKVNPKSIGCSFIKKRGLESPRVVTKNVKTSAFFDMVWGLVKAEKTTDELIKEAKVEKELNIA
jgi:hypothetical protein